jgi:hypothetical protein
MNKKINVLYKVFSKSFKREIRTTWFEDDGRVFYSEATEEVGVIEKNNNGIINTLIVVKAYRFKNEVLVISDLGFRISKAKDLK